MKTNRQNYVPVVDLFAGPGGLGEGFSAFKDPDVDFELVLSVEKDAAAFRTLLLRAFFRQFPPGRAPDDYYEYLQGQMSLEQLKTAFAQEFHQAESRCLHLEMGPRTTARVYTQIQARIDVTKPWVLVGGPPCQAYSIVGRSRRSRVHREEFERDERHVLYREYLRILAKFRPPVFVMENVKGLLSAEFGGTSTFQRLIMDLQSPTVALRESAAEAKPKTRRGAEYVIYSLVHPSKDSFALKPEQYVIESERFGIPQRRHRVILLGVRVDFELAKPRPLKPSSSPSVIDVIGDLPPLRSQLSDARLENGIYWANRLQELLDSVRPAIITDDIWEHMRKKAMLLKYSATVGGRYVCANGNSQHIKSGSALSRWFRDDRMEFFCNHETRFHKSEDLLRYLFVSTYGELFGKSPKLHHFPDCLLPDHKNVGKTLELRHGNFNDRFRVQVAGEPATTVTSHIAKDGHYFIHHDPLQCRSWTVREAARVQTFPDNYLFEGYRTDQYRQVGNAVPPYLAMQIAAVAASIVKQIR